MRKATVKTTKKGRREGSSRVKRPYGGRPSLKEAEQLRDHILDVASELFTTHGYAETSIEAIAARAGIGKLTLYRRFGDKDTLFRGVVVRLADQRHAEIAQVTQGEGDLGDVLVALGHQLLNVVLSPESLAFHRILFAESARMPDLCGRIYQDKGSNSPVQSAFQRFADAGALRIDDVRMLDQQFVQSIIGRPLLRALLGGPPMSASEREEHVRKTTHLFLYGVSAHCFCKGWPPEDGHG